MTFKHAYPGRLTEQQWRALPLEKRRELATRAQCDLLGSFRYCRDKRCRRARTCCGEPMACTQRLWARRSRQPSPKRLIKEYARLADLPRA